MEVTWAVFKAFVTARTLSIQYIDLDDTYWMKAIDGPFELECKLYKLDADTTNKLDFENNYQANGNKSFTDVDGSPLMRPKAAKKGWTYAMVPIEIQTATFGSLYSKNVDGTDRAGITLKFYNGSDVEVTDPADYATIVKTVMTYEPAFDYELIGGTCSQKTKPGSDIRIWVVAVPDVPFAYGGSREMICGVNLDFIDPSDKVNADGRASKLMSYSATYHTNKMQIVLKHDGGVQHDLMIVFETFRA